MDSQKPSIAQTLSRLFINFKKHDEAFKWASKAIELKDIFNFYDTRGQAMKAKLKQILKNPKTRPGEHT